MEMKGTVEAPTNYTNDKAAVLIERKASLIKNWYCSWPI